MNKKFMIVALMATLSATGYAYSNVTGNMVGSANTNSVNSVFAEVQEDVNKINNSLAGKADQADLDTLKNQVSNNTATTTTNS